MEAFLKMLLLGSHGVFAYVSIFSILVACGLGIPLPEDVSLILGGFLAHQGAVKLPIMIAVGFFGILAGDSIIYLFGRKFGREGGVAAGFFSRIVTPEKRLKVEGLFTSHGEKIVMLARFLPGVRAVTYFTAGSAGMPYRRFILFDGCAALGSAPLFVLLGYKFGNELEMLVKKIKDGQLFVLSMLLVLAVGYLVFKRVRTRANARRHEAAARALLAAQLDLEAPATRAAAGAPRSEIRALGS